MDLLTDFPKEQLTVATQQAVIPKENDEDAFTIYLGEVADTLRTSRKRITAELEKQGYKVVTGIPPPDETAAHEKAAKDALQSADLSVHLLDIYPGREITGSPDICFPQKQAQLALEQNKPKMIWVPAEADFTAIDDEGYKTFMQVLESGKASANAYEFVRGSISTVAQQIIDYAAQLKSQQLMKQPGKGNLSVLLDTHFNDQLYALDLSKALLENHIQPFINPQEDDPGKNINLLGDRISQVKKLIFLYGSVSKEWVLARMSAALQLIITNNYPIEDFFIYMAPPYKESGDISLNQRFLKVNIINSSSNQVLDKTVLDKFLNELKADAA